MLRREAVTRQACTRLVASSASVADTARSAPSDASSTPTVAGGSGPSSVTAPSLRLIACRVSRSAL